MITKVTSANYNDYTLLFNQADTALKEASGEPIEDFLKLKDNIEEEKFDSTIQYFNERYEPVSFTDEADFNARDLTKDWYKLNEAIVYNLDTYFGQLQALANIDYSFLRLPIDEPTFNIVDGGNGGRRVIEVPDVFKSGISVQGDETAEILFFSIDRYYDATDLWHPDMNFIIQWKTATKNGVTKAFINKDGRPFLDNGKLYFGWPISSEITEEAGNITFSVRIFRFATGTNSEGKPKLAFGLNTQTASTRISESIAFEFKNTAEFEDAETINKTSDIISRVYNSTVMSETKQATSPTPIIRQDILSDELLGEALSVIPIIEDVYTLAVDDFVDGETYYNGSPEHNVVTGLNENNYRKGVYFIKRTITHNYYEFDYNQIANEVLQIQATAPSGIITYSGIAASEPYAQVVNGEEKWFQPATVGGRMEVLMDDGILFKQVNAIEEPLPRFDLDQKYYEKDKDTGKFTVAKNIITDPETDDSWVPEDRIMELTVNGEHPCKYYKRYSPQIRIIPNDPNPVGCYWIVAYNNESKKAMSSADSYKIWIPGPVDLTDANIIDYDYDYDNDGFVRIQLNENHQAEIQVGTQNVEPKDSVKTQWYESINGVFTPVESLNAISFDEDLALLDKKIKVEYTSVRNNKESSVKVGKKFRVTDKPHKFKFDTVADSEGEAEHEVDHVKVINKMFDEAGAYDFKIDFSLNLDENEELNILSDKIAYRFKMRTKGDVVQNIFLNDYRVPINGNDGFQLATFEELKEKVFHMEQDDQFYYVELINIVNEKFGEEELAELNAIADAVHGEQSLANTAAWAPYEDRISRTEYRRVIA